MVVRERTDVVVVVSFLLFDLVRSCSTLFDLCPFFSPRYLAHLVHDGEFSQAAALCPRLLQYDVDMWNRWVLVFAEHDQLLLIGAYVRLSFFHLC